MFYNLKFGLRLLKLTSKFKPDRLLLFEDEECLILLVLAKSYQSLWNCLKENHCINIYKSVPKVNHVIMEVKHYLHLGGTRSVLFRESYRGDWCQTLLTPTLGEGRTFFLVRTSTTHLREVWWNSFGCFEFKVCIGSLQTNSFDPSQVLCTS